LHPTTIDQAFFPSLKRLAKHKDKTATTKKKAPYNKQLSKRNTTPNQDTAKDTA